MKKIVVTGSEGLLGSEISKFLEKSYKVYRLDLKLGHDLTDQRFVKNWFKKNHSDYLINCFAIFSDITLFPVFGLFVLIKETGSIMPLLAIIEYVCANFRGVT